MSPIVRRFAVPARRRRRRRRRGIADAVPIFRALARLPSLAAPPRELRPRESDAHRLPVLDLGQSRHGDAERRRASRDGDARPDTRRRALDDDDDGDARARRVASRGARDVERGDASVGRARDGDDDDDGARVDDDDGARDDSSARVDDAGAEDVRARARARERGGEKSTARER